MLYKVTFSYHFFLSEQFLHIFIYSNLVFPRAVSSAYRTGPWQNTLIWGIIATSGMKGGGKRSQASPPPPGF
jgi:hypothetical protein